MRDSSEHSPEHSPSLCPVCGSGNHNKRSVKVGAYLFAFICASFLSYQTWSHDRRGEPLSPLYWMPLLLLTGTALGVNVDANKIAVLLMKQE